MSALRFVVLAAVTVAFAIELLPGPPTSTARPVSVHFDGLPAAVLSALQR